MKIEEKYRDSREAPLYKATERLLSQIDDLFDFLQRGRKHTHGQHMLNIVLGMLDCVSLAYGFPKMRAEQLQLYLTRYNSYMGYLVHRNTYAIRWRLWNMIDDETKQYVYMSENMAVMHVRSEYKERNKLIKLYSHGKKNFHTRRVHGNEYRVC